MSYDSYADQPIQELTAVYEDLLDFHRTAPRAKDKATARVALRPVVEELQRRGVEAAVPEWTAEDVAQYKAEATS